MCKQSRYNQAKLSIHDRNLKVAAVVESLEREMELLCLTGVEDQLQADVRPTLEMLRNAGIKVLNTYCWHNRLSFINFLNQDIIYIYLYSGSFKVRNVSSPKHFWTWTSRNKQDTVCKVSLPAIGFINLKLTSVEKLPMDRCMCVSVIHSLAVYRKLSLLTVNEFGTRFVWQQCFQVWHS